MLLPSGQLVLNRHITHDPVLSANACYRQCPRNQVLSPFRRKPLRNPEKIRIMQPIAIAIAGTFRLAACTGLEGASGLITVRELRIRWKWAFAEPNRTRAPRIILPHPNLALH